MSKLYLTGHEVNQAVAAFLARQGFHFPEAPEILEPDELVAVDIPTKTPDRSVADEYERELHRVQ